MPQNEFSFKHKVIRLRQFRGRPFPAKTTLTTEPAAEVHMFTDSDVGHAGTFDAPFATAHPA